MLYQSRLLAAFVCCLLVFSSVPIRALGQEYTSAPPEADHDQPSNVRVIDEGTHLIDAASLQAVEHLTVRRGATALIDVGNLANLVLPGDFTNKGTVYFGSSVAGVDTASLTAANIFNKGGAVLSSVLPAGGLAGFNSVVSNLNLDLTAVHDIINAGTIASAGNLTMTAGGAIVNQATISAAQNVNLSSAIGNIVNSGTISALAGNININSQLTQLVASQVAANLTVTNTGGIMQALNGAIDLSPVSAGASADLNLTGGDWLSRELNLNAGAGKVSLNANNVSGVVNIDAGCANLLVSAPNLNLGSLNITGDPTFYNTGGSVILTNTNSFQVNANLAVVASQDVVIGSPSQRIQTAPGSGQPGDVLLIAGANFTPPPAIQNQQSGSDTTTTITIQGGSSTGGSVQVPGGIMTDGGLVTIVAYPGSGAGSLLPPGTIRVGDISTNRGRVAIVAGATSGIGIVTGNITTSGTSGDKNGGNVAIFAAPIISPQFSITNGVPDPNPAPFIVSGTDNNSALIFTGNILTAGAGGNGGTNGSLNGQAGGAGGDVAIGSNAAISTGFIRAFGGGGGGGTHSGS
ncbi:MAG TPA: hypothetical protein V6D08_01405, partial [Candidatus Obscuribacterales bacterium]